MHTLKDILNNRTSRMLNATAQAHQIRFDNKPLKVVQQATLYQRMVERSALVRAVAGLSPAELAALQALQAADQHLPYTTFRRAFGEVRPYRPWRDDQPPHPWRRPISIAEKLHFLGLIDLVGDKDDPEVWLAAEVNALLPPLPHVQPAYQEDVGEGHAPPSQFNRANVCQDVAIFLASLLYADVKLMWGRWLPPMALQMINQRLPHPATVGKSELQSPRLRFIHYLTEVAGLVSVQNGFLKLTVRAWRWLEMSSEKQWAMLWAAWQADVQKRASRYANYRLPTVTRTVWAQIEPRLAALPPGQSFTLDSFLEATQPYLPGEDLADLPPLLAGPLTWAGLVALEDGVLAIPLADKQDAALRKGFITTVGASHDSPLLPDGVNPRLFLTLPTAPPLRPLVEVLSYAQVSAEGFWLDAKAMQKAVGMGYTAVMVAQSLAKLLKTRLDPTILAQLESWERRAQRLVLREMVVLTAPDAQLLAHLRADRHLRPFFQATLSAHHVAVAPHSLAELSQRLARRGMPLTDQLPKTAQGPLTERMLEYIWLTVRVYQDLQAVCELPVRVPGAVEDWLKPQLPKPNAIVQMARDVVAQVERAIAGYAPQTAPILQENPDFIRFAIESARTHQEALTIEYFSPGQGRLTQRTIEPLMPIAENNGAEYLEAWCQLDEAPRTFRLDRIVRIVDVPPALPLARQPDERPLWERVLE